MSPKLRVISGKNLCKIIEKYGFVQTRTVGSHVRMTLKQANGSFHVTIPFHRELRKGTLSQILRELEYCVDRASLEKDLYTT
jgi:predicted RNA binding protein YcfA (HicA-like mRNA interferase family)